MTSAELWDKVDHISTLVDHYFNQAVLFKLQGVGVTVSNLFAALIIFLLAFAVSKWLRFVFKRRVVPRLRLDAGLDLAFQRTLHYITLLLGAYLALTSLGVQLAGLLGLVAVLGVGIGFGMQHVAANFISGLILLFDRPIKVGDRITVDNVEGDVTMINLRTTVVISEDNVAVIIPNSKLLENNLTNWSYGDPRTRIHLPVGVAYGSDLELVKRALLEAAAGCARILKEPAPAVHFLAFGDSSLNFELVCWQATPLHKSEIISELNFAIERLFRQYRIEIPYPQRDLRLRAGDAPLRVELAPPPPTRP